MKTDKIVPMDDKGISALIGIFLVLGIAVIFAGIIQSRSVPEWNKAIEADHFNTIYADMLDIRQAIERTARYELPQTTVVHASLDYPTRMFLQNPSKTGATITTFNDKKITITYEGIPIEVLNSCTIHVKENYNYFLAPEIIIEHGMIIGKIGQDNYTMENPLMNNKTIDLDLVECIDNSIGITSSTSLHLFPLGDLIVENSNITFSTEYPNLWVKYFASINVNFVPDGNNITLTNINSTRLNITRIGSITNSSNSTCVINCSNHSDPTPNIPGNFSRTYSNNSDFDEGTLDYLNHDEKPDQLQINTSGYTNFSYHFIWVPNTNLGTVSKVDTRTGNEVGRYRVNSDRTHGGDPSRTTVDLKGDVWVGTRRAGTVVKIGEYESGHCQDRNKDGIISTSRDTNNDGNITGAELLDWGKDECVLYEVVLISGKEGTFVPGTYKKSYDTNYWGVAPRGLAIDARNNLWAGTYSTKKYYYIDGETGQININKTIDVSPWGHSAYGAVIDGNSILWSANLRDHVLRINTSNTTDIQKIRVDNTYGICLDYLGHLFTAGSSKSSKDARLVKYDINGSNPVFLWNKSSRTYRGVVSTRDNNIWVAGINSSGKYNSVTRYDNNGTLIANISGFHDPSGVAVDEAGKIWVTDIKSNNIYRINSSTNTIDLTKDLIGSGGHYTYSDMTGFIVKTITTTTTMGNWTVIYNSNISNTPWGKISWNSSKPDGTDIIVSARSSNDQANWSNWTGATKGIYLNPIIYGSYVEIKTTLQIQSVNTSPVLYDLTVSSAN